MGLDITAYRGLKPAPAAELDADGYPVDYQSHMKPGAGFAWSEKTWPGRCPELVEGTVYSSTEQLAFRAGSYSGYNDWRSWLAKLAGFSGAGDFWDRATETEPFYELINFADNEGIIGAAAAAELAKDFAEYETRARETSEGSDDWQLVVYGLWLKACEMAADGGAIEFH